jgi:hypothetical protein
MVVEVLLRRTLELVVPQRARLVGSGEGISHRRYSAAAEPYIVVGSTETSWIHGESRLEGGE